MKKSRFTDSQILAILKQHEAGVPVADLSREHNVSTALIYQWRSKFGGMDASMMKRLKELEVENAQLKKMYAEECIKAELRQEALEGNPFRHESNSQFSRTTFSLATGEEEYLNEDEFTRAKNPHIGRGLLEPLLGMPCFSIEKGVAA